MSPEERFKIFKYIVISAALIMGILCEAFGIHMLYKKTEVIIGTFPFSAGLYLLIIGLLIIVAGLVSFSKSNPRQ